MVPVVAFTRGENGADLCHKGEWRHVDAFPAAVVDPTGAGDVFASAFLIRLSEGDDVWAAARFASCAASFVVEAEGVTGVPTRRQVEERLKQYPL
jgi:sugar/nucleoside kinase (ribokinase family)